MCYADRGSLPQSVRWWQGQLKCLHQRSTSSAGRNGLVGVLNRVYQTMPSLDWSGIPLVYIVLLFLLFLEPHWIHKASNHPAILKLMHHFYLQHPPSRKHFDPWDVECLLSLLGSWAPISALTTFKLAWKTATLLALVTAKCCSDLTLLCINNQHLFLQHNAAIFIPMSGGKTDHLGHLPPQIHIESHSNVNFCPVFFYFKAYLRHTESFRSKPDGSHVTSLFLGNNRQHQPVCAKTISSWVRKVLCVAKVLMSLGSLWGVAASAAFMVVFPW